MKRKIVLKIIEIIVFNFIGLLILLGLNSLLKPTALQSKIIKGFYDEPKDSLDVVYFGDSSIHKGVSPLEIWKEYGITGYDFATPVQKVWDSYYSMKEVFQYQKPKVMVLEINECFSDEPLKMSYKSLLYDNMKFGIPKLEGIMDPVQKNNLKNKIEFLFPILKFHSRWSELNKKDFASYEDMYKYNFKGYSIVKTKKAFYKEKIKVKNGNNVIPETVYKYLAKIKELTQENNSELLLVSIPNPVTINDEKIKQVNEWAEENKVKFINFNNTDIINIDWKKDTGDGGNHLNINGARKVSKYLGQYLVDNFQLKDHRGEAEYEKWNSDLADYEKYLGK